MRATPINNTRGGAVTALLPFTLSIFPFSSTTFPSLIPRRSFGLLFRFEFTGARGESRWKDTTTRPPIIPLSTLAVHSTTRINSSRAPPRRCQASPFFLPILCSQRETEKRKWVTGNAKRENEQLHTSVVRLI